MNVFASTLCHMHPYLLLDKGMVLQGNSICHQTPVCACSPSRGGHATGEPVIAVVHFTDGLVAGGRAAPHFFDASGVNYADDVVNGDGGLSHVCGHYYLAHSLPSPLKHPCLQPIPVHMLPTTYVSGVAPT